jgi:hypothetical protein
MRQRPSAENADETAPAKQWRAGNFVASRQPEKATDARHPRLSRPRLPRGECDHEDSLGDLLADLVHWSDVRNFGFAAVLDRAPRSL